ncbi:hypothetical protein BpHYR1_021041, partial [Brachionus plicatilis]
RKIISIVGKSGQPDKTSSTVDHPVISEIIETINENFAIDSAQISLEQRVELRMLLNEVKGKSPKKSSDIGDQNIIKRPHLEEEFRDKTKYDIHNIEHYKNETFACMGNLKDEEYEESLESNFRILNDQ